MKYFQKLSLRIRVLNTKQNALTEAEVSIYCAFFSMLIFYGPTFSFTGGIRSFLAAIPLGSIVGKCAFLFLTLTEEKCSPVHCSVQRKLNARSRSILYFLWKQSRCQALPFPSPFPHCILPSPLCTLLNQIYQMAEIDRGKIILECEIYLFIYS